jgi:DNA-directed RNA polymerase specialized sigma24 family protein
LAAKSNYTGKIEDFESFIPIPEEMNDFRESQFQAMNHSLLQLGEPCRTIIEDYYMHNLNMVQISEKFGYTNAENAKNQKYKCLNRLKKMFFNTYKEQD